MAAETKGLKRICTGCGTRFYDFNKRPIVCPNCKAEYKGEMKVKTRRGKALAEKDEVPAGKAAKIAPSAPTEDDEVPSDLVSLEDVKKMEEGDDKDEEAGDDEDLGGDDDLAVVIEEDDLEDDLDVKIDKD